MQNANANAFTLLLIFFINKCLVLMKNINIKTKLHGKYFKIFKSKTLKTYIDIPNTVSNIQ